jgi:hypothetical protein
VLPTTAGGKVLVAGRACVEAEVHRSASLLSSGSHAASLDDLLARVSSGIRKFIHPVKHRGQALGLLLSHQYSVAEHAQGHWKGVDVSLVDHLQSLALLPGSHFKCHVLPVLIHHTEEHCPEDRSDAAPEQSVYRFTEQDILYLTRNTATPARRGGSGATSDSGSDGSNDDDHDDKDEDKDDPAVSLSLSSSSAVVLEPNPLLTRWKGRIPFVGGRRCWTTLTEHVEDYIEHTGNECQPGEVNNHYFSNAIVIEPVAPPSADDKAKKPKSKSSAAAGGGAGTKKRRLAPS